MIQDIISMRLKLVWWWKWGGFWDLYQ